MKLLLAVVLAAITVGCGYSSKTTTPAQPGTVPVISQLTPAATNAGAPAFMLEVDGSKFAGQATVNFGATKINPTFVNSGKLQAMVPATAVAAAGTVHVTVTKYGWRDLRWRHPARNIRRDGLYCQLTGNYPDGHPPSGYLG